MPRSSKLFVVQGDLAAVQANVTIVPSDARLNVGERWADLVPSEADQRTAPGGFVRIIPASDDPSTNPRVRRILVADVAHKREVSEGTGDDYQDSVKHLRRGLNAALDEAENLGEFHEGKLPVRPLLSLPLVGTGAGGFAKRRGGAIKAILEVLDERLPMLGFDVVLVCYSRSDYEAVQSTRESRDALWTDEAGAQLEHLVGQARQGSMAVLFGAGASMAMGHPTWSDLLTELAAMGDSGDELGDLSTLDPVDAAALLSKSLPQPDGLQDALKKLLDRPGCTLTQALLASMRPTVAITTNYDTGYEQALAAVLRDGSVTPASDAADRNESDVRVLPWDSIEDQGRPRVVKLHGDLSRGSIVLSRDQFVQMHAYRRPLTALLQERMLAGTVLALGTSFSDSTLTEAVFEVMSLRQSLAHGQVPTPALGTFLLTGDDPARRALLGNAFNSLDAAHLLRGDPDPELTTQELARRVDLFLDELALRSRNGLGYLGDPAYSDLLDDLDPPLRKLATEIVTLRKTLDNTIDQSTPDDADRLQSLSAVLDSFGATSPPATSDRRLGPSGG